MGTDALSGTDLGPSGIEYAGFISYSHREPDAAAAKRIQRALETFTVPRRLRRAHGLPKRIGKFFRDEDELSAAPRLSERLEDALRRSRHLIVICSPHAVASRWVGEEIGYFRRARGDDGILALLADGEPADAFPPALLHADVVAAESADGEPLAADIRPHSGTRPRARWRDATLRLAAAILGCDYDDLRRRDRERRRRRVAGFAVTIVVALAAFAFGALTIEQGRLESESLRLADRARLLIDQKHYRDAIATALAGMPKSGNFSDRPLVQRTADALMGAILEGAVEPAATQIFGPSVIRGNDAVLSPDGRFVATFEVDSLNFGAIHLWNVATGTELRQLGPDKTPHGTVRNFKMLRFSDDSRYLILGYSDLVIVRDVEGASPPLQVTVKAPDFVKVELDAAARRLLAFGKNWCTVFDLAAPARQLDCGHGTPVAARLSPDGKRLITFGAEPPRLWDLERNRPLRDLSDATGTVMSAAFAPRSDRFVTGSSDGSATVWNAADGSRAVALPKHGERVVYVGFARDGREIVTGEDFSHQFQSKPATPLEELAMSADKNYVSPVLVSDRAAMRVRVMTNDSIARVFDDTGKLRAAYPTQPLFPATLFDANSNRELGRPDSGVVAGAAFDPNGALITLGFDNVRRWTMLRTDLVSVLPSDDALALLRRSGAARTNAAKAFQIAKEQNVLRVRDAANNEVRRVDLGNRAWVANERGDKLILFGSTDVPELIALPDGAPKRLGATEGSVTQAIFQPGGDLLAIRSVDGKVRLWNAADAVLLATLAAAPVGGPSMIFSGDGGMLFVVLPNENKALVVKLPRPGDLVALANRILDASK